MEIKPKVKSILILSTWIITAIGMFVLLGFVNQRQEQLLCKQIVVNIDESVAHDFIDNNDIIQLVNSKGKVEGKALGSINTSMLEKIILTNPFV